MMRISKRVIAITLVLGLVSIAGSATAQDSLGYHRMRLSPDGRLLPWYDDAPSTSYDFVIRRVWDFWNNVQQCGGAPSYMVSRIWDPNCFASGIGGDQLAMALSSWDLLYDYMGDENIIANMRYIADTYLANSLSAPTDAWPELPYPCNLQQRTVYDGDLISGVGVTQPDKAGSFGFELVRLYKKTGDEKYLNAAVRIADVLASKITVGDSSNSPLPFRVNTRTGEVLYPYTTAWTGTLGLFESLTALGVGNIQAYAMGTFRLREWLLKYPLVNNQWGPYFEDVVGWSNTEINAVSFANYLIDHPGFDSNWQRDARRILDWAYTTFADSSLKQFGVYPIDEQTVYYAPGQSHTSRYAAAELAYHERLGDSFDVSPFVAQLNWATYSVDNDGKNRYPHDSIWFTDGYGDYVRHYIHAMASYPELAPADSDHILYSQSVIRIVKYSDAVIRYETFDSNSSEEIRMSAKPAEVLVGDKSIDNLPSSAHGYPDIQGWTWTALNSGGVVRVHHDAGNIIDIRRATSSVATDNNSSIHLDIFPNPASAEVNMLTDSKLPCTVQIFDKLGHTVFTSHFLGRSRWNTQDPSGKHVPSGLYLARIAVGRATVTRTIVVTR